MRKVKENEKNCFSVLFEARITLKTTVFQVLVSPISPLMIDTKGAVVNVKKGENICKRNSFGSGGSTLIFLSLRTGNQEKVRNCASFCIWTGVSVTLFCGIAVVSLEPVLISISGASTDTLE